MTVKEICDELGWKRICGTADKNVSGCYIGDLLSRVMGKCNGHDIWITVQTSRNMLAVAELADVAAVLFPEDIQISEEILCLAGQEGITLLGCQESAFDAAVALAKLIKTE